MTTRSNNNINLRNVEELSHVSDVIISQVQLIVDKHIAKIMNRQWSNESYNRSRIRNLKAQKEEVDRKLAELTAESNNIRAERDELQRRLNTIEQRYGEQLLLNDITGWLDNVIFAAQQARQTINTAYGNVAQEHVPYNGNANQVFTRADDDLISLSLSDPDMTDDPANK